MKDIPDDVLEILHRWKEVVSLEPTILNEVNDESISKPYTLEEFRLCNPCGSLTFYIGIQVPEKCPKCSGDWTCTPYPELTQVTFRY